MNASPFAASSAEPFQGAVDWLTGTLLGNIAVSFCVLAIAVLGLMMFTGRLPVREGLRVVIGCFVLLGAPLIAAGFAGAWSGAIDGPAVQVAPLPDPSPRAELSPADYDPYAGASVRDDR